MKWPVNLATTFLTHFKKSLFQKMAHFKKGLFQKLAYFKNGLFQKMAYFKNGLFQKMAHFKNWPNSKIDLFYEWVYFKNVTFFSKKKRHNFWKRTIYRLYSIITYIYKKEITKKCFLVEWDKKRRFEKVLPNIIYKYKL